MLKVNGVPRRQSFDEQVECPMTRPSHVSGRLRRVLGVLVMGVFVFVGRSFADTVRVVSVEANVRLQLGKEFDVIEPTSAGAGGGVFAIDGEITGWNPGNAAKRIIIGLGSGRESTDLRFRVTNSSGQNVLDRVETIRTNFYSQGAGS